MAHGVLAACAVIGIISNILALIIAFILLYTHRKAIIALFNGQSFTSADTSHSKRDTSQDTHELQEVVVQSGRQRATSTWEATVDIEAPAPHSPEVSKRSNAPCVTTEGSVERISEQTIELDGLETPTIQVAPPDDVKSQTSYDAYVDHAFASPSTHLQEIMVDPDMDVTSSSGEATITAGRNSPISEDDENHSTVVLSRSTELPSLRFSDVYSSAVLDKMHSEGHRQAFMPYQESFKHFSVIGDTQISQPLSSSSPQPIDQNDILNDGADLPQESLRHTVNICSPAYDNDAYLEMEDDEDESLRHVHERPLTVPSIYYSVPPEDYEEFDNLAYVSDLPESPLENIPVRSDMYDEYHSESLRQEHEQHEHKHEPVIALEHEYQEVYQHQQQLQKEPEEVLTYVSDLPNEPLSMFVEVRRYSFSTTLTPIGSMTSEESDLHTQSYDLVEEETNAHLFYQHDLPSTPLKEYVVEIPHFEHLEVSVHRQAESVTSEDSFIRSYEVVPEHEIYEYSPRPNSPDIHEVLIYTPDLLQEPYISIVDMPLIDFSEPVLNHDVVEHAVHEHHVIEHAVVEHDAVEHAVVEHAEVQSSASSYYEDYEILEYVADLPQEPYHFIIDPPLIDFTESDAVSSYSYHFSYDKFEHNTVLDYEPDIAEQELTFIVNEVSSESSDEEFDEFLTYVPDIPERALNQYVDVIPSVSYHIRESIPVVDHPIVDQPRIINHTIRVLHHPIVHSHTTFDHPAPLEVHQLAFKPDLPSIPYYKEFHIYRPSEQGIEHRTGSSPYLEDQARELHVPEQLTEDHVIESSSYAYQNSIHNEAEDHLVTNELTKRVSILDPIKEEPSEHIIKSSTYSLDANERARLAVADILQEVEDISSNEPRKSSPLLNEAVRDEIMQANPISRFVLDQMALQDDFMRRYNELLRNSFNFRYNSDIDTFSTPSASPTLMNHPESIKYEISGSAPRSEDLIDELTRRNARLRGDSNGSSTFDDIGMRHPPVVFTDFNPPPSAFDMMIQKKKEYSFGTGATPTEQTNINQPSHNGRSESNEHRSAVTIDAALPFMKKTTTSFGTGVSPSESVNASQLASVSLRDPTTSQEPIQIGGGVQISSSSYSLGQGASISSSHQQSLIGSQLKNTDDSPPLSFSSFQWHSDTLQEQYNKELNSDLYGEGSSDNTVRKRR